MEKKITVVEKFDVVASVLRSISDEFDVNGVVITTEELAEFIDERKAQVVKKSASRKPKDTTIEDRIASAILDTLENVDSPKSATEIANLVGFVEGYEKALTSQKILSPLKSLVASGKVKVETVKRVNVYSLA